MTDTLLRSLREHLLDESEPLAGLLRKCLMLGAETGSEALRAWARKELDGYSDEDAVPEYRRIHAAISMDSTSGRFWREGDIIHRHQLPREARKYVPDKLEFRQPVEELARLAEQQKTLRFGSPGLAYAQSVWNSKLDPLQSIDGLSYTLSGSVISGILGQIRTRLVEIVADLTADTPLSELPKKEQVDAAVSYRIRDVYNTTIQTGSGPVSVGAEAKATTEGLTIEDAVRLLDEVQKAATKVAETERGEILDALAELRAVVKSNHSDTGEVVKKAGKLRAAAEKLGVPSVTAAVSGVAQAVAELAMSGAFG